MAVSRSSARTMQVIVAVLAVVLVGAFMSSHCEATTNLVGLPIWKCTGPLGLDGIVSGTSTDSEFTARLMAFGVELIAGGGTLAIIFLVLQKAAGSASE